MSDSSTIQQARDILAEWRQLAHDTAWEVDTNQPFSEDLVGLFIEADHEYAVKFDPDEQPDVSTARLIVGTAGNPDLLDAIDGMLKLTGEYNLPAGSTSRVIDRAQRLAAAIISADERMTS